MSESPIRPYPSVLIAAPQHSSKLYCFEQWINTVLSLSYPAGRLGVFIADNSKDKSVQDICGHYPGIVYQHVRPSGNIAQILADSHNACREYALTNGYDFMLHLETDIFPQIPNVIERLLWHGKVVTGATFNVFEGSRRNPVIRKLANHYPLKRFYDLEGYHTSFMDGQFGKVHQIGLGCVLIHKGVLRRTKFRWSNDLAETGMFPDTCFGLDLYYQGIDVWCDPTIPIYHYSKSWNPMQPQKDKEQIQ